MKNKKKEALPPPPVRITVDENTGLTDEQVLNRILDGHANTPVESPSKTVGQIIASNVFTYFNLIFFILGIALAAVGAFKELTFLVVVIANILIGTVQELKAKKTLDRLQLLNSPQAKVIREGRETETNIENLVLDDIAVFSAGDQICADAEVIAGDVSVNESLITGEADEISKYPGDALLSGSFVVAGRCCARLNAVGSESFVSKLTLDAKKSKKRKPAGMMKSLTRLIQVIGIMIIPVAVLLLINQTQKLGMTVPDAIVKTSAALIGMIPEGLYLLTSIALAVSVVRLAQRHTLVHELNCIETLARVDVLCVDKTGTITENEMYVTGVYPFNSDVSDIESVLSDYTANQTAENNTMIALRRHFAKDEFRTASQVIPFSSSYKYSAVCFEGGENYILGAPEFVLRDLYIDYRERIEKLAADRSRVLVLAITPSPLSGGELNVRVTPLALVTLANRVRENAAETFRYFASQGVEVKVISGDNPVTVSSAARDAGIPNYDKYIDAEVLDTNEKISAAVNDYTVFGRVTPEQKRQIIRALRASGHKVAMTGDGVNDVLALKEADCSIAMASGSDVAGQVSQLVLLDSDFSHMPSVVAEGRRVINNIERSASLFLVKNIFSFIMAWVTIIGVFAYPLQPSQLTLINAFTIGIPSFILALEANTNIVKGRFMSNVIYRAFPAGLTDFVLVMFTILFGKAFDMTGDQTSTIAAILMGITGLIMLGFVCRPFNRKRILLFVLMAVGFVFSAVALGSIVFSIEPLNYGSTLVTVVLALLSLPLMLCFIKLLDLSRNFFANLGRKISAKNEKS